MHGLNVHVIFFSYKIKIFQRIFVKFSDQFLRSVFYRNYLWYIERKKSST